MVQVTCQRCGNSNEAERLNLAHFTLKHGKGCGSGIGIVKVSGKSFHKVEGKSAETVILDEAKPTEKPKSKKSKFKRKKKSDSTSVS